MIKRLALLSILFVSGCGGYSAFEVGFRDAEALETVPALAVCNAYNLLHSAKLKDEIIRRDIVPESEWDLIAREKICVGMTECGLICSWGLPVAYGDTHESVGVWGKHRQYVYRTSPYSFGQCVYVENGKIMGWDN